MTEAERKCIRDIYSYYGFDHQLDKTCEECAELIQALLKGRCNGWASDDVAHVQEELADVQIMIEQMQIAFGSIEKMVRLKLDRTVQRMVKDD